MVSDWLAIMLGAYFFLLRIELFIPAYSGISLRGAKLGYLSVAMYTILSDCWFILQTLLCYVM